MSNILYESEIEDLALELLRDENGYNDIIHCPWKMGINQILIQAFS